VFIAGVVDSGDKLFTGVNDNTKRPEWDTQGPGGNFFMKKPEVKNLVSGSL
jgi:hypothetical protein